MKNFILRYWSWISSILNIILVPLACAKLSALNWIPENFQLNRENFYFFLCYATLAIFIIINIYFQKVKQDFNELNLELNFYKKTFELTTQTLQACISKSLTSCAHRLKLEDEEKYEDRITVFGIRKEGFFVLDRYSENPEYRKIKSNKIYPYDKGCIAKGYQNDWHFESGENISSNDQYKPYFKEHYNLTRVCF